MPAPTYEWRDGSQFKTDPQVAGPVLKSFIQKGAQAADLVSAARALPKQHWLRKELWIDKNDADLAEIAREDRARAMLRSITVVRPNEPPRRLTVVVRAGVDNDKEYVSRQRALHNRAMRAQMVRNGNRTLQSFIASYGDMPEFAVVIHAIETHLSQQALAS